MAYSTSPVTVERLAALLQPLAEGLECEWTTADGKGRYFAYKVREALAAAEANKDTFPELAAAAGRFEIKVLGRSRVAAQFKTSILDETTLTQGKSVLVARPVLGPSGIKEQWTEVKAAGRDRLYFPGENYEWSPEELLDLHSWCQSEGLMFFEADGSITVMPYDEESAPFAWSPEDLEDSDV